MIRDLTTGNVTRQLLMFTIPFMIANLLQTLYNIVDMIVIGQFVGSTGLSAVSIGGEVIHLLTFICIGYSSAGQILISQYVGKADHKSISHTIGTMFTSVAALAIVFTVVGLFCTDWILNALNTPPEAFDQARDYVVIGLIGLIFIFGYNIVSSILRGMGDSKRPLIFIAIAAVLNLVLDLWFVAGLDMGTFGAGLATVIGQAVSFIISIIYLYIKREAFGFDFKLKSFAIHKDNLILMSRLGLPIALQLFFIMFSGMVVSAMVNAYGVVASAITGVGNKLNSIASVVTMALGTGGSTMVGQNLGAQRYDRTSKVIYTIMVISIAFCCLLSLIIILFPDFIFGLFTSDTEVLEMISAYVPVSVIGFMAFGLRSPFTALVNGIGHASLSLFIGIFDGVVARLGLAFLLGMVLDLGVYGYWYGSAIAGITPAVIGGIYFFSGAWKKRKIITS